MYLFILSASYDLVISKVIEMSKNPASREMRITNEPKEVLKLFGNESYIQIADILAHNVTVLGFGMLTGLYSQEHSL